MKTNLVRKTCDLCLNRSVELDGDGLEIEPYSTPLPSYVWVTVGGHDVCPFCGQILERAMNLGLISWKPLFFPGFRRSECPK